MTLRVAVVTTGHEVLRGSIVDGNGAWLSLASTEAGASVVARRVASDDVDSIAAAVAAAAREADEVVVTGGLGPTEDDRTREALAAAASLPLRHDERAWAIVLARFEKASRTP